MFRSYDDWKSDDSGYSYEDACIDADLAEGEEAEPARFVVQTDRFATWGNDERDEDGSVVFAPFTAGAAQEFADTLRH